MTDDQAYNIWQSACISLLPKWKKHQSIHKWVVFLLIVYDSTVRSGDLFWLRLNLKHMERHNFLAGSCLPRNYAWPLPVVLLFREGLRGIRGLLITLTQDASRGSWFKRGSDSVALVCFHMEWGDIVTLGCALQWKQEQQCCPQRLSTVISGTIVFCIFVKLERLVKVRAFLFLPCLLST